MVIGKQKNDEIVDFCDLFYANHHIRRDLTSASFFDIFRKIKLSTLLVSRGAGGGPGQRLSSPLPFMVICIKTYRSLAKMGLVLERGAYFQDVCFYDIFPNTTFPS